MTRQASTLWSTGRITFPFAVPTMAHTKSTAKPPSSSRNPPPQARRVVPGANLLPARDPTRASGAPSSRAERPATSHANPAQATPPVARGASLPPKDYKELYPWATSALLKETSSINTELGVHRLRKGDQSELSFHEEHDSKMAVLPCLAGEPICADDKANKDELFCQGSSADVMFWPTFTQLELPLTS